MLENTSAFLNWQSGVTSPIMGEFRTMLSRSKRELSKQAVGLSNPAVAALRGHMSDRRSLAGTSLAAETGESRDEESRLKGGCSQDWLPHKAGRFANRPQVCQPAPQSARISAQVKGFW